MVKRRFARLLALLLLLTALPMGAIDVNAESASNIRLTKTQGSVTVYNAAHRSQTVRNDMRLMNGYNVQTSNKAFAWLMLDSSKSGKMDSNASVELRSRSRKLDVMIRTGKVFFNVSKKLDSNESMKIRTSTMVTGIRGTLIEVGAPQPDTTVVLVYEGGADVQTSDGNTTHVAAGQMATVTKEEPVQTGGEADINVETRPIQKEDVSGSVLMEAATNPEVAERIDAATDGELAMGEVTVAEANGVIQEEQAVIEDQIQQIQEDVATQETTQDNVFGETQQEVKPEDNTGGDTTKPAENTNDTEENNNNGTEESSSSSSRPKVNYPKEAVLSVGDYPSSPSCSVTSELFSSVVNPDSSSQGSQSDYYTATITKGQTLEFSLWASASNYDFKVTMFSSAGSGSTVEPVSEVLTPYSTTESGERKFRYETKTNDFFTSYVVNVTATQTGPDAGYSWLTIGSIENGSLVSVEQDNETLTPISSSVYSVVKNKPVYVTVKPANNYYFDDDSSNTPHFTATLSDGSGNITPSSDFFTWSIDSETRYESITINMAGTWPDRLTLSCSGATQKTPIAESVTLNPISSREIQLVLSQVQGSGAVWLSTSPTYDSNDTDNIEVTGPNVGTSTTTYTYTGTVAYGKLNPDTPYYAHLVPLDSKYSVRSSVASVKPATAVFTSVLNKGSDNTYTEVSGNKTVTTGSDSATVSFTNGVLKIEYTDTVIQYIIADQYGGGMAGSSADYYKIDSNGQQAGDLYRLVSTQLNLTDSQRYKIRLYKEGGESLDNEIKITISKE